MPIINILLDKAKVIHTLRTDYQLCKALEIPSSQMTSYRKNKTMPDIRVLAKICMLTGDDLGIVMAEVEAKRARFPEVQRAWLDVAARLSAGLISAVFAFGLLVFIPNGNNALAATNAPLLKIETNIHCGILERAYIYLSQIVRRWLWFSPMVLPQQGITHA